MVLKRFLIVALGAFGLGALVSGSALAQQIPPPNLSSGALDCKNKGGDVTRKAAKPQALTKPRDKQVKSVVEMLTEGTGGVALITAGEPTDGAYMMIGTGTDLQKAFVECQGDPVGDGFSEARKLERAVYNRRSRPESTAYQTAVENLDELGGAVYMALHEETQALRDMKTAIDEWNALLVEDDATTTVVEGAYRAALEDYRNIAITGLVDTAEVTTATADQSEGAYGKNQVQGYRTLLGGADGTTPDVLGAFVVGGDSPTDVTSEEFNNDLNAMFDSTGALRKAPVGTAAQRTTAISDIATIGGLVDQLRNWNLAVDAQEERNRKLEENKLAVPTVDANRLAKLKAGQAYVKGELDRLLSVAEFSYAVGEAVTETFGGAIEGFNTALDDLESARDGITGAAEVLEDAQADLYTKLTMTDTYLEQLVGLRQWEFDTASEKDREDEESTVSKNLAAAKSLLASQEAIPDPDSPAGALRTALLIPDGDPGDDDGQALIDAVEANTNLIEDVKASVPDALDIDTSGIGDNEKAIEKNVTAIEMNAEDIDALQKEVGFVDSQHDGPEGCSSRIDCNEVRSEHNEQGIKDLGVQVATNTTMLGDHEMRITANATAIETETMERKAADEALGMRIDTNWDAIEVNQMDIDANEAAIAVNRTDIDANEAAIAVNRTDIDANEAAIMAEAQTRMEHDMMLVTAIEEEAMTRASADMAMSGRIGANEGNISSNASAIAANMSSIGSNASAIGDNRNMIGELSDDLDVVRAGVAASMALAGMPAINGRGISIGVGSFDGESAFAVGFQIQGEQASFKVGITSGGGATGASAGVGFNF